MSDYRRARTKGGTYFFTVVTQRRERFLCDDDVRGLLHDALAATRLTHPFVIDGWVLLPDHLHWHLDLAAGRPCLNSARSIGFFDISHNVD